RTEDLVFGVRHSYPQPSCSAGCGTSTPNRHLPSPRDAVTVARRRLPDRHRTTAPVLEAPYSGPMAIDDAGATDGAARTREHLDSRLIDASLAVALTLVVALVSAADSAPAAPFPGLVWAAGFGALMLLRRPLPILVLPVPVLGIFAHFALDLPPIGMVRPAVGALYSAAELRRTS